MNKPAMEIAAALFILLISAGCGGDKQVWEGTVSEEDGIKVIKNPREPLSAGPVPTLERDLAIGGAGAVGENMFSEVSSLDIDRQGSIYVLSDDDSAVFVFDREGRFIRRFGRKGQGPAELDLPLSVSISGNEIMIPQASRRISFFSTEGEFLRSSSTKEFWILVAAMDSRKRIYATVGHLDPDNPLYRLLRFDYDLGSPQEITDSPAPPPSAFNPFMPVSRWQIDPSDNVIFSRPAQYAFEYYDPAGKLFKKVMKDYDPVKITDEEKENRKKEIPPEIKLAFSDYHPAFNRFYCDDRGRLFVRTFEKSAGGELLYDVFDAESRFLTRITFKGEVMKISGGDMYLREEDEDGFQQVVRYRLVWNLE